METKVGDTAVSDSTKYKVEALQKRFKDQKGKIDGGIIMSDGGV